MLRQRLFRLSIKGRYRPNAAVLVALALTDAEVGGMTGNSVCEWGMSKSCLWSNEHKLIIKMTAPAAVFCCPPAKRINAIASPS